MTDTCRIFVNGDAVDASRGESVIDAIARWRPDVAGTLDDGERMLTDSRGLMIPNDTPAYAGAIFRVVSARANQSANIAEEGD